MTESSISKLPLVERLQLSDNILDETGSFIRMRGQTALSRVGCDLHLQNINLGSKLLSVIPSLVRGHSLSIHFTRWCGIERLMASAAPLGRES